MRTLEFAIWERAQTSSLRQHCSHLLTRSLSLDASIQLRHERGYDYYGRDGYYERGWHDDRRY